MLSYNLESEDFQNPKEDRNFPAVRMVRKNHHQQIGTRTSKSQPCVHHGNFSRFPKGKKDEVCPWSQTAQRVQTELNFHPSLRLKLVPTLNSENITSNKITILSLDQLPPSFQLHKWAHFVMVMQTSYSPVLL